MRVRSLTVAAACAVLLASCSGGDDTPRLDSASATTAAAPSSTGRASAPATLSAPSTSIAPTTTRATAVTTTTAPTAPATSTVEQQLAASVRGFFAAREAASAAPAANPDSAQLAEYASGEALRNVRDETTRRRDAGQAIRAGSGNIAQIRVGFVTVTGATAMVAACSIDDGVIYEVASGRVVNDAVITHNYRIDLAQSGAVWRVARIVRIQQWEGVGGCANSLGDFPY